MDSMLRDLDREQAKMLTDIENLNRHYGNLTDYVRQHVMQTTVEWARLIITHPKALVLVMETTRVVDEHGSTYGGESEPIRLTWLSLVSGEMKDYLFAPTHSREVRGFEYHGLTLDDLKNKPRLSEVWPQIAEELVDHHVIIFSASWARQSMETVSLHHAFDNAYCLHDKAKEFYGEFYDLSLEKVLSYQGIDKKREDLKDSPDRLQMLAQVVQNFAAGMPKQLEEQPEDDIDLDDHPF